MRAPPGPAIGLFAGRYAIERVIGQGATATVHLARDTKGGTAVAIKMLRPELAQTRASDRFLKEIGRTAALQHPNILPVLDSGEFEGQLYFVLPYMEGGTLRQLLKREAHLEFSRVLAISRSVADALDYAHQRGLIHRDVKPENILFTSGEACLGDFGIARALDLSGNIDASSTSKDMVRGTPAYMSPEQAAGGTDLDGRSDIYSLGCVIYEMITGMQAFIGPTPESVISQRFAFPPREVRVYRPTAPPAIDDVLSKAFAMIPADRYQTAGALVHELQEMWASTPTTSGSRKGVTLASSRAVRYNRWAAGAIVLTLLLAFSASRLRFPFKPRAPVADTSRLAVLPLEHEGSSAPPWRDDDLLQQGFSRWRGIAVVDQFQISDAVRRVGSIRSITDASRIATSLGAGRFIRGRVTAEPDGWRISASLYDAQREQPLYQANERVPADLIGAMRGYARVADSLLLRGVPADSIPLGVAGSRSLPAVQAFGRAQTALDEWDLARADSGFASALGYDPDFARASLWLAQVRAWQNQSRTSWGGIAQRAAAMSDQLSERERKLTEALVLLAKGSYESACAVYEALGRRNDRDFAAWFGMGQCRMLDKAVIADRASPSGWRFRASAHRAMEAYGRAFEILPSVHRGYERGAFERLRVLLLVTTDVISGRGLADSAVFQARPDWRGDSLVLVPYPWQVIASGAGSATPPGMAEALARRRAAFRRIAAGWSSAFPRSAGAKYAVAMSLELLQDAAAIDTIRLARQLTTDSLRQLQLAAAEVLLLVKFGAPDDLARLRRAQTLADSVLERATAPATSDAELLGSLAALTGHCAQTQDFVRRSASSGSYRVPASLFADGQVLFAYMVMGCATRSLPTTLPRLAADIAAQIPLNRPGDRSLAEALLLFRPLLLSEASDAGLVQRVASATGGGVIGAAAALARGDTSVARTLLGESENVSGATTPDISLARARLLGRVGDRAAAMRVLDMTLDSARTFDPNTLQEPAKAASFVAAMLDRSRLAAAVGDSATARRWRDAVRILWLSADPDVRSQLEPRQ